MKKIQINIDWSVVFWVSIIILFLWLIAKAVGLIHTPWIVEAIPYVVGLMAIFAVVKEVGKYAYKIDTLVFDLKELKDRANKLEANTYNIDKRLAVVESKI